MPLEVAVYYRDVARMAAGGLCDSPQIRLRPTFVLHVLRSWNSGAASALLRAPPPSILSPECGSARKPRCLTARGFLL